MGKQQVLLVKEGHLLPSPQVVSDARAVDQFRNETVSKKI